MKKVKFEKKLSLKKQTIVNLSEVQLNNVNGGNKPQTYSCATCAPHCDYTW